MILKYVLSLLAGGLTTLSPCVLPALPLIAGSAVQEHRFGIFAVAGGMITSFTVVGLFLAILGSQLGIDPDILRKISAVLLVLAGITLISTFLQTKLSKLLGLFSAKVNSLVSIERTKGLWGQFVLGSLLGAVWSPCVGPTLGTTLTLATESQNIFSAFIMMLLFGIGATAPLVGFGLASKQLALKLKSKLARIGGNGKFVFGSLVIVVGVFAFTGIDQELEQWVLDLLPKWWIRFVSAL